MAGEQVRNAIDEAFQSPPKPLSTVSLVDFTLGQNPPTVTGVRFIERTKHQVAHLEMGIVFSSDQNIVLEVRRREPATRKAPAPAPAPCPVNLLARNAQGVRRRRR